MKVLTIDIGGTAIKSALFCDQEIIKSKEVPSKGAEGIEALMQALNQLIESYEGFDVIGIDTAGLVERSSGRVIAANNIPGYGGFALKEVVQKKYGCPVYVENDVNAAGIAEGIYGAAKEYQHYVCLTFGTGIGGAVVVGGKLYTGTKDMAGEIGHMITHPEVRGEKGEPMGYYEKYASTRALVEKIGSVRPELKDGRMIFEAFEQGDDQVKGLIDAWIDEVLLGLVGVAHALSPEAIILGGGVMKQPYVIKQLRTRWAYYVLAQYKEILLLPAELGNQAGLYGMLGMIHEEKTGKSK